MASCPEYVTESGFNLLELLGVGSAFVIGVSAVIFTVYLLQVVYCIWIGPFLGHNIDVKKMGKWAVVTGSTDGIGKAFACELAKKGMSIVLISRSPSKLQTVAEEIEKKHGVETKTIAVDFSRGHDIYENIEKELTNLEIGVLVNNVGMSYEYPELFLDIPDRHKKIVDMLYCNMFSVTFMIEMVLPQMVQRHKGLIVNMASLGAVASSPLLSVYGATKAYVDKLSRDLHIEYLHKGVYVQSIIPAFVVSNMSKVHRPSMMVPTAETYVKSAMQCMGMQAQTGAYLMHRFYLQVAMFFGFFLPSLASKSAYNALKELRKKALKKREREKQQ